MPKAPVANRGALWALFWTIGVLMGLFVREFVEEAGHPVGEARAAGVDLAVIDDGPAAPPTPIVLRAVLELPSPTPANTPTPTATRTPSPTTPADYCTDEEPGALCRVPYPPPPTPTPFPSCAEMEDLSPGTLCVWPTATPAASGPPVASDSASQQGGPR